MYLTMAPNTFLAEHHELCATGYSTGLSVISQCHYQQMVMILAYFLLRISQLAYIVIGGVYEQDLEHEDPVWTFVTNIMYVHIFSIENYIYNLSYL